MILVQLFLFPFHFLFRIVARTFLLITTLGTALVLPLLVLYASTELKRMEIGVGGLIHFFSGEMGLVAVLSALGIFSIVLNKTWKTVLGSLSKIGKEVWSIVAEGWMPAPALDFGTSLSTTWSDNIAQMYPKAKQVALSFGKLILSLFLLLLVLVLVYLSTMDERQWRNGVIDLLRKPPPHVVVVTPEDSIESYLFQKGTVFSLAFIDNGSPKTGDGICLTEGQEAWLTEFKKAIVKCSEKSKIRLEVMGFASIAPAKGKGLGGADASSSAALNCEIGNSRAEEVVDFLIGDAGDDFECGIGANRRRNEDDRYGRTDQCQRSKPEFVFEAGPNLTISYKPWPSHDQLVSEKPADDGRLEQGQRLYEVEFLNRSVHLRLGENACRVAAVGN